MVKAARDAWLSGPLTQHSNRLSTKAISAVGKRNFPGQRQRPRNAPCNPIGRLQRQNARTNRRQFGAIRTEVGNLRLRRTAWWRTQSQSNLSPHLISLLTGKSTGNFIEHWRFAPFSLAERQASSDTCGKIPYSIKTGNFPNRTGIELSRNREASQPSGNSRVQARFDGSNYGCRLRQLKPARQQTGFIDQKFQGVSHGKER
jgi:hypothetical protein